MNLVYEVGQRVLISKSPDANFLFIGTVSRVTPKGFAEVKKPNGEIYPDLFAPTGMVRSSGERLYLKIISDEATLNYYKSLFAEINRKKVIRQNRAKMSYVLHNFDDKNLETFLDNLSEEQQTYLLNIYEKHYAQKCVWC